jgi:acetoacetyl-CoA synthetase
MMWNWQLTAVASGVPILLYDGSVSYPDATALLRVLDEEGITVFGTSPAYLQLLRESGVEPRTVAPFEALRALQSTGSILYEPQFDWVRDAFKAVPIQSISGGTDIIGCFVLGNPLLPVYRGESQCVSLGMDARVWTDAGGVERTGTGELVCVNPFPSRPVGIWGDGSGVRFHDSYFAEHEGLWTHGDMVELTEHGSARVLGRSDGTLKIRGVRIGPAELYTVVLTIPGVREAMAVEQEAPREPGGRRIVLLVVLGAGLSLDRELTLRIKRELSQRASPVHVPALVLQMSGLPQTHNGKYSERAARDVVNHRRPANLAALRNPECLDELARLLPTEDA